MSSYSPFCLKLSNALAKPIRPEYGLVIWLVVSFVGGSGLFGPHSISAQLEEHNSIELRERAEAHLRLGIDFFLTDELEVAIDEFQEATKLYPGYAEAYHNLGVVLAKRGDVTGAIAAWSKAQRLDPSEVPFRYHLSALVSYNYGVALLFEGQLKSAMSEWTKALSIQPDLAEAHYAVGLGYLILGNVQQAAVKFNDALSWSPDWPEAHFQQGVAYYEIREFDLAEQAWRKTLQLQPSFAEAYSNLGLVRFLQGDLAAAIDFARQAIALDPDLASAQFNLSLAYMAEGAWESAGKPLQSVITLQPQFTQGRILQGVLWSRLGRWARAINEWRQALQTHPTPSEAARIHFNIGLALSLLGDRHGTILELKQTLAYQPKWAEAHYHLGVARESIKDWKGALRAFERTIALKPSWAHAYLNLGRVHAQLGSVSKAIEAYSHAVELEPNFADAHYQLGVTLRAQNRAAEAIAPLQAAAKGGMVEAQTLLASMLANGSGVPRDLPRAMRWWFRSASQVSSLKASLEARDRLSHLRRQIYQGEGTSTDLAEIKEGFRMIRQSFPQAGPTLNGNSAQLLPGGTFLQPSEGNESVSVLIQKALVLDTSAHQELQTLYVRGVEGALNPNDPSILEYFIQTASETNEESCHFLEDLVNRQLIENSGSIRKALETCY